MRPGSSRTLRQVGDLLLPRRRLRQGAYYDAHPIEHMSHHLTMLACDMNNEPLSFGHGAPLRLRTEIGVGFKQVKWIRGIEFVADFSEVGPATAATTKTTSSSATGNPSERPPC